MIKLFRKTKQSYWNNLDIPAKIFFKIIDASDLSLLGNAPKIILEKAWDEIIDEYYTVSKNTKIKAYLDKQTKVKLLELKIHKIRECVFALMRVIPGELIEEKKIIQEALKKLDVKYDYTKNTVEQCHRIIKSDLGILRNQLNMILSSIPEQKEKVIKVFEEDLSQIMRVLGFSIPADLSMYLFLSHANTAKEISEANKKSITKSKNGK